MKLLHQDLLELDGYECNGCGPKGYGWLIPDRLFLIDFNKACNIHDVMYQMLNIFTKDYSDDVFYKNLKRINKKKSKTKTGYYLRKPILKLYYLAVKKFGKYYVGQ